MDWRASRRRGFIGPVQRGEPGPQRLEGRGLRPSSSASARRSTRPASSSSTSRSAASTGTWPGWDFSVSRSSSQASRWSRMLQHPHQHAGQALAARRARRLQQDVAGGLQLVGQRGLLPDQLADQGCAFIPRPGGHWRELQRLRAHEAGQRQQGVGQHLHPVARIEHGVGQRGPDQVQPRAEREKQAGGQVGGAVGMVWHGHREDHGKHDRHRQRDAALAPGRCQKGDEAGRHQQHPEAKRIGMQHLHAQEQRQADQCRRQQLPELAALGRRLVGRNADDDADRCRRRRKGAEEQVNQAGDHQQTERRRQAVEHVVAQGRPQGRAAAGFEGVRVRHRDATARACRRSSPGRRWLSSPLQRPASPAACPSCRSSGSGKRTSPPRPGSR